MTDDAWITAALVALLLPAVIFDIRYRRIPNILVFPFWLLAPLLHLLLAGSDAMVTSLAGLGVALALTLPVWLIGWFGAGDVKLVTATGALVGLNLVWQMLASIAITGALLALLALILHRSVGQTFERLWASLSLTVASRKGVLVEAHGDEQPVRLPYAIAIACGTLLVWLNHMYVIVFWH